MPPVRDWHVGWLVAVWLVTPMVFFLLRWIIHAGVWEAELDGRRVVIVSGLWSSDFASGVTALLGGACLLTLVGITVAWLAGRKHRRRLASMTESEDRRPLM